MPRKQNGFGSTQSFAFKGGGRVDKGKGVGAFGRYPSQRRYGTTVHRTVIEKWDLDSNWAQWRRGFEIYNQACYSRFLTTNPDFIRGDSDVEYGIAELYSLLYQGTDFPTQVLFDGYEFPTQNSDVNTHYVARREPLPYLLETDADGNVTQVPNDISVGTVTQVFNDELRYPEQKRYGEIWVKGSPNIRGRALLQMIEERLTDGETEATMKNLLTAEGKPGIYYGQTAPKDIRESSEFDLLPTEVTVTIPADKIEINPNVQDVYIIDQGLSTYRGKATKISAKNNYQDLVDKIIYLPDFFKDRLIADMPQVVWADDPVYFAAVVVDSGTADEVYGLDPGQSVLPPSMYDISELPQIFKATDATYTITGTYIFQKSDYQRFFGNVYMGADQVAEEVVTASYSVLPFLVKSVDVINGNVVIQSVPFESEIAMHPELTADGTLIFHDKSFIRQEPCNNDKFKYQLYTDVDPWQDPIFEAGGSLQPAVTYACSCPAFSKSILAVPQQTQDKNTRKVNRQRRYPLPTAMGLDRFSGSGANKAAGKITSWGRKSINGEYTMCKHSIAAMYVDGIKLIEPGQYPTIEARQAFAEKLAQEMDNYNSTFRQSFERSGLSLAEIVFALAQGLNLDNVETAYVVLNSN